MIPNPANNIDNVINETLSSKGGITSSLTLSENEALDAGMKFIGNDYKEIGNGVFRSKVPNPDGTYNQFRIDNNSIAGNHQPGVPHFHLEVIDESKIGIAQQVVNNHIITNP